MEVIPAYDRDVLVRCLTRHFETLARMGYMEDSNIQHAPPGGWGDSQIDAKSLRIMGRNETVIDLLRHLPYLENQCEVLPETTPIKYLGRKWDDTVADKMAKSKSLMEFYPLMPFDAEPEPGMICLTYGRLGDWLLIDTTQGYVYPCGTHWNVHAAPDDPLWLWYKPVAIEAYFDGIYRQLLCLDIVPMPHVVHKRKRGPPDELEHQVYNAGEQEAIAVKQIFQEHGWPNFETFRKEECIKAANEARLRVVEKRTFRWREEEIIDAEARGDIEDKKKSELRLKEARIEYDHEWE